jgi:hypothetical protein
VIPYISQVSCGTQCTEGRNCAGFAYKPSEQSCYLSKTGILGKPYDSLYVDDYSKLDRRCNKIDRITDSKRIDGLTLIENSVYLCSDGENNTISQFQYANMGALALDGKDRGNKGNKGNKGNRGNIKNNKDDLFPEQVIYDVYDIIWPKIKQDPTIIAPIPYSNFGTIDKNN